MKLVVAKFGGTSVASSQHILNAARKVADEIAAGHQVVVVISAMAGETNRLLDLTTHFSMPANPREVDVVIAAGEQVTCGLMAIALQSLGFQAQSCLGWQVPILTTAHHTKARITSTDTQKLQELLAKGIIPVIAGFQGITASGEITTFGRGGSDLTAVAVAAALNADCCLLFKDVDGIYSADPHVIDKAHLLEELTYEEMLELTSLGSKVVQPRAVISAIAYDVDVHVKPVQGQQSGTRIMKKRIVKEQELITGIVCNKGETKICLKETPVSPSIVACFFGALADAKIAVDMIIQNGYLEGQTVDDLTFTLAQEDTDKALQIARSLRTTLGYKEIICSKRVTKISVVGAGMRGHASVAHKLFATLAQNGISIHGVSTSEIKISVLVSSDYADLAMRALHTTFGLDIKDFENEQGGTTAA